MQVRLLEVPHPLDIEAVGPVDVPQKFDGDVFLHRVLHLDELVLVGGGGVGGGVSASHCSDTSASTVTVCSAGP